MLNRTTDRTLKQTSVGKNNAMKNLSAPKVNITTPTPIFSSHISSSVSDNKSRSLQKNKGIQDKASKPQSMDTRDLQWLTHFFIDNYFSEPGPIIGKLVQFVKKIIGKFSKAIVFLQSHKNCSQFINCKQCSEQLKNMTDSVSSLNYTTKQKTIIEFNKPSSNIKILLTDLQPENIFAQGRVRSQYINLIINLKLPENPAQYLSRLPRHKLSGQYKGIVLSLIPMVKNGYTFTQNKGLISNYQKNLKIKLQAVSSLIKYDQILKLPVYLTAQMQPIHSNSTDNQNLNNISKAHSAINQSNNVAINNQGALKQVNSLQSYERQHSTHSSLINRTYSHNKGNMQTGQTNYVAGLNNIHLDGQQGSQNTMQKSFSNTKYRSQIVQPGKEQHLSSGHTLMQNGAEIHQQGNSENNNFSKQQHYAKNQQNYQTQTRNIGKVSSPTNNQHHNIIHSIDRHGATKLQQQLKQQIKELEKAVQKERQLKQAEVARNNQLQKQHRQQIEKLKSQVQKQIQYKQQQINSLKNTIAQLEKQLQSKNNPYAHSHNNSYLNGHVNYSSNSNNNSQNQMCKQLNTLVISELGVNLGIDPQNYDNKLNQLRDAIRKNRQKPSFYPSFFLTQSQIYQELMSDQQRQFLHQSIKKITYKDPKRTKTLFEGYPGITFDQWLYKISRKNNLLVLMLTENNHIFAGFAQDYFTTENQNVYKSGDGFMMSLTNMKKYDLKSSYRGKAVKNDLYIFGLGNNEMMIKHNFTFSFIIDRAFCHYQTSGISNNQFIGQVHENGKYKRVEFHQIFAY